MRYENRVYGSRQELIRELTAAGLTPARSEKRQRELARIVGLLEDGEDYVESGSTVYVVEEDPDVTDR